MLRQQLPIFRPMAFKASRSRGQLVASWQRKNALCRRRRLSPLATSTFSLSRVILRSGLRVACYTAVAQGL